MDNELEDKIAKYLQDQLSKRDLDLEVGRFIFKNDLFQEDNTVQFWVIKQNMRQINETSLQLDEFENCEVTMTFVHPSFFLDVFDIENSVDVPFWQIATVKRVLKSCKIVYDPDSFISEMVFKSKTLVWNPELINLKKKVSEELIQKALHFINQDMVPDAYIWGIKAVEEAICSQLMLHNAFNITTPALLLSSLREQFPDLMSFYLDLLGIEILTPDLTFIELKELEKVSDHIFHSSTGKRREQWILTAFVSINEAERKLMKVLNKASDENLDVLQWEYLFEDVLAELWQAFFIAAQTPWNNEVPLDPWIVGLFWKWHINETPKYDIQELIDRCRLILENGSPLFDWER